MNQDLNETVMSPPRKKLFQRKRSEYDEIGRNNNLSFQHTLPELKTKQSIGQYSAYKSVMVDPALNFVNPTRKHLQFTKSDKLDKGISPSATAREVVSESLNGEDKSESIVGPITFTKKLINAQSTQFSLEKPKYQLSRRTFGIGYSMSPNQFAATTSKISLSPSQNQSVINNQNLFTRVVKDQNLKIDAKECETETSFELCNNPTEQKVLLQHLLEFYNSMMMTIVGQMTPSHQASIVEIAQLVRRITKSIQHTSVRIKSLQAKELDLMRGEVGRAEDQREKMAGELEDFKQNRTIEAYFARFKKIPNPEDRKQLISMIDLYLSDEKAVPKQETYGIRDESAGAEIVLQGLEEPTNIPLDVQEQSTLDAFERRLADTLKEVKSVMLTEAEGVRRLTERNIRDKQALTGGRVPMRNKGTETITWSVIHNKFQSQIDDANSKFAQLQETTERQLKTALAAAAARGKEVYALEQKVEALENYKKRTNIQNIQRQMSDILFSILQNQMDGQQAAEVMIKYQEAVKAVDKNQQVAISQARKTDQNIDGQKKAGLFKMKVIKNTDPAVDILESSPVEKKDILSPSERSPTLANKPSLVPLILPKADKQTLKVIEWNITDISTILKETDELVDLFMTKRELCQALEDQFDLFGEALQIIKNLPENLLHIISACEQTRGSNVGPTTQLQSLHLKNKIDKLLDSEEFEKSKRIVIQFRQLPVIRLLIDKISKVKDQEASVLKSEDEALKIAFMSEVVQTLCQILSAKEKLTLLPDTQGIALIIQVFGQVKEIKDHLSGLLVPEQSKFLSQATTQVKAQKKAFGELGHLNSELQRLIPKTVEWEKVQENATTTINQAIIASENMKGIHKMDKDLLKIVIKTQEMIKNHQNKADDFVQANSPKQKKLNKVEEEDLEYRYDSDGGDAVLVLDTPSNKSPASKAVPGKSGQKLDVAKVVQKPNAPVQQKVKMFSKEELDQTVEKETKRRIQEAISDLMQKHEEEKNSLLAQLQKAVVTQIKTKPTTSGNDPLEKPLAERSESRSSNKQNLSTERDPVEEANNQSPATESSNNVQKALQEKKISTTQPLKQQKVKKTAATINDQGPTLKQAKQAKALQSKSEINNKTPVKEPSKPTKEIKNIEVVKKDSFQSPTEETPKFPNSNEDAPNASLSKRMSNSQQKNQSFQMEPITEENAQEPDEKVDQIIDDSNSVDTIERSKFSALDSNLNRVILKESLLEQHSQDEKPQLTAISFNQPVKIDTSSPDQIFNKSTEQNGRSDQQWIPKSNNLNQTTKTVASEQPKQKIENRQGQNVSQSIETLQKIDADRQESIFTPPEIEHLEQPRLVTQQVGSDQTELAQSDRNLKLDVKLKSQRDFTGDKSEFQPSINFKNKNRKPMMATPIEKNEELYTSTIYDRTSQQSYHHQELGQPLQEEINLSYQKQITRRDSHSTLGEKLEPKLHIGLTPQKGNKDLNSDLATVQASSSSQKRITLSKPLIVTKKSTFDQRKEAGDQTSQTQGGDTLDEFLNLVSSAFDQLMASMPSDPYVKQSILNRIAYFTEQLVNINKDYGLKSNQSLYEEIKSHEQTIQQEASPRVLEKKASPRQLPSLNMFEQPGTYQLEFNSQKKPRVTVKNVGRIGGGFLGHAAK